MSKVAAVLVLFSLALSGVLALECYSCSNCNSPTNVQKCASGQICAITRWRNTTTNTRVERTCAVSGYCNVVPNSTFFEGFSFNRTSCDTCNSDKCNFAPGMPSSLGLIVMAAVGAVLVSRR